MRFLSLALSVAICLATPLAIEAADLFGDDLFGNAEHDAQSEDVAPLLVGTLPGGLITDYAEALRQAQFAGMDLTVVCGLSDHEAERIANAAGEREVVCLGSLKQYPRGVHRYVQTPEGLRLAPPKSRSESTSAASQGGFSSCPGGRCRLR